MFERLKKKNEKGGVKMKGSWTKTVSILLLIVMVTTMSNGVFAYDKFFENASAGYESSNYTALVTLPSKKASSNNLSLDGTQSNWAEAELVDAYIYGLTYPDVMEKFKQPITREEFCTIVVKLYERLTGKTAEVGKDPFDDTDNSEILKAYNLHIVNGTAKDKFSPSNNITRQEISVMIYRALDVSIASLDKSEPEDFPFTDAKKIASWAKDAMKFVYKNQIMKGTGNNEISPLNNTTREQAIVLLKRTFEKYSGAEEIKATIPVQLGNLPMTDEHEKFTKIEPGQNLAFLDYDERIELFVATTEEKPPSLPTISTTNDSSSKTDELVISSLQPITPIKTSDPSIEQTNDLLKLQLIDNKPIYTQGSYSAFIDANGNKERWFAYRLNNASGAKKVIWQVSKSPFNGFTENWKNPIGLVGSGEVTASKGEFQIDFGNLKINSSRGLSYNIKPIINLKSSYKPIPQKQSVYYVRAVPVDSAGKVIGEPGEGVAVVYGEKFPVSDPKSAIQPSFELWTPFGIGYGYQIDHVPFDPPSHNPTASVDPRSNNPRLFHFHELDDAYKQIVIQVSTKPFLTNGGGWPETPNLIYEETYNLPTTTFADAGSIAYFDDDQYPATVPLIFTQFGKPASEMKEGDYIKYYVRGVALKDSIEPGQYDVIYSDTVTTEYGYAAPIHWYSDSPYTNTEKLQVTTPGLKIKSYTPVKWQDSDYMHHYYVFKEPTADEITSKWKNTNTGETLYPYRYPYMSYYKTLGINSKAEYEAEIIPRVLPKYATVFFPEPDDDDKAWYEQLFDGIVDFFTDLWKAVETVVNQVSAAYTNLKSGLILFVADLCPVESLKGAFKTALEGLVNYGLMSVGIPPTLPNFDDLTEMSVDYLAEVALTEAGIPPNDITKEVLKEVAEGIKNEIEKAVHYADANPINANFLKLDPEYLYRPAYVDVEIYNNTAVPSVAGSFNIHVTFEMDYYDQTSTPYDGGVGLVVETNYAAGSAPAIQAESEYREHFWHGLNGNTLDYAYKGDKAIYDVLYPRIGVKAPALSEGESSVVRVYLDPFPTFPHHLSFTRYPEGEYVRKIDFENMYFNNGGKEFTHFTISGQFPTSKEYLIDQGILYLDSETEYIFTTNYSQSAYEKVQKPVNSSWSN